MSEYKWNVLFLLPVYEQQDAAEYCQKILRMTSPDAAKVKALLSSKQKILHQFFFVSDHLQSHRLAVNEIQLTGSFQTKNANQFMSWFFFNSQIIHISFMKTT